jgi:hypothetical protein
MNARLWLFGIGVMSVAFSASATNNFPAPKDAKVDIVGEDMLLNGVTMSAWELRSERAPETVLAFYRNLWAQGVNGQPGFTEQTLGDWRIVTHINQKEGLVFTVQAQPMIGGTLALLGVSDLLRGMVTPRTKLADDLPKLAGSEVQNDLVAQDLGVRSRTIVMTNTHSVQQNLDFYINHFERKGWQVEQGMAMDQHGTGALIVVAGGSRWNMTFSRQPKAGTTHMVAVLEER